MLLEGKVATPRLQALLGRVGRAAQAEASSAEWTVRWAYERVAVGDLPTSIRAQVVDV